MAITNWLKNILFKLLHNEKVCSIQQVEVNKLKCGQCIIFDDVQCDSKNLYVDFHLDGSRVVQLWDEFREEREAMVAVTKARWNCRDLQGLAESLRDEKIEKSYAEELLNEMRLNARTARDRASVQLGRDPHAWY